MNFSYHSLRVFVFVLAFAGILNDFPVQVYGQSVSHVPLYTLTSDVAENVFGRTVDGAGDVNADGIPDFLVAAAGIESRGSVSVFSGRDGSLVYTFQGDGFSDGLGSSLAGVGDLNGDGHDEFIFGVPLDDTTGGNAGSAQVISGRTGEVMFNFEGLDTENFFGNSVASAGDVDGDGVSDVVVSSLGRFGRSVARVFSGTNGDLLHEFEHGRGSESVGSAGDVNGDGFSDVIVGGRSGGLLVYSGGSGEVLYSVSGELPGGDSFGVAVNLAGDVNGDGVGDIIVGAPGTDTILEGSASVVSGVDGSTIYRFEGDVISGLFGISVDGVGDVNGDGSADVAVGFPHDDQNGVGSGSVTVYSGLDGSELYYFSGDAAFDSFGWSVSGLGDINRDGLGDFLVGAPQGNPSSGSGYVRVFVSQISVPEPGCLWVLLGCLVAELSRRRPCN